ncbi:hypothetical protein ACHAXT_003446 [Thalassiosira profunda]
MAAPAMEPMGRSILHGNDRQEEEEEEDGFLLLEDDSMHANDNDESMKYDDFPLEEHKDGSVEERMQQQFMEPQQQHNNEESKESGRNDGNDAWVQLLNLPPHLQPSMGHHGVPVGGMRRVSSCYFSIASNFSGGGAEYPAAAAFTDTASFHSPHPGHFHGSGHGHRSLPGHHYDALSFEGRNASDFLLHDVLMSVFSFLDAHALAAFSETGRRPNFEVFYFLELQLQRALLVGEGHRYAARTDLGCVDEMEEDGEAGHVMLEGELEGEEDVALLPQDVLADEEGEGENEEEGANEEPDEAKGRNAVPSFEGSIAGTGVVSRLASLDSASARKIVQTYLDSNASLHALPLSHSLAYFRQVLSRPHPHLFPHPPPLPDGMAKNARNAALFFTVLGAAYMRAQQGDVPMPDPRTMMPDPSEVLTEENVEAMKGVMLKMGLMGGFLKAGQTMKEKAEQRNRATSSDGEGGEGDAQGENGDNSEQPDNRETGGDATDQAAGAVVGTSRRTTSIGSMEDLGSILPNPTAFASRLYNAFSSGTSLAAAGPSSPKTSAANLDAPASDEDQGSALDDQQEGASPSHRRHRSKRSHQTLRHTENEEYATSAEEKKSEPEDKEQEKAEPLPSPEEVAYAMDHPFSPNPYDHVPPPSTDNDALDAKLGVGGSQHPSNDSAVSSATTSFFSFSAQPDSTHAVDSANVPSGCVGAYANAVKTAASELTRLVKEERQQNFEALSEIEQHELGVRFIDACSSDSKIHIVKEILQKQRKMDVDRFFVGPDDTETCALHAAAFNGAENVLKFLCGAIAENDPDEDGGLCDVNVRDANGWTALHFAAGANSVTSVRVLSRCGAELTIEAGNGYTPYHWAERLSNEEVAAELQRLGADNRFVGRWMFGASSDGGEGRKIPFVSFLANRFFASSR